VSRISVLMPMRNAEPYVRDAVSSIIAQDVSDLELVVVDDGSSDGSKAALSAFDDPRMRVLDGPQRGVSACWNAALDSATAGIIMQCDADDLFPPDRVRWQLEFLESHPEFGAVCGVFSTIDRAGRPVADLWTRDVHAEEVTEELLHGRTRTHLCTFAVRREHLETIGGKREFFESAEDIDLQLRLAEVCRVWFEPRCAYRYRLHDSSLTHTQPSARRRFYEQYARELRAQRAAGRPDDIQRGIPREPPAFMSQPDRSASQVQGQLLGEAWRMHSRGMKLRATRLGVRALARAPANLEVWRSLAALILKPTHGKIPK
jgi:glycosyltransferase involved in cell wall biosynthesis